MAARSYADPRLAELHSPPRPEPEAPWRLSYLLGELRGHPRLELLELEPRHELLGLVHEGRYLRALRELSSRCGRGCYLDGEAGTYVGRGTWLALGVAAALVERAVEAAWGRWRAGLVLALVRPPGHHASRSRPGGYCLANFAALAAALLLERGAERVAVVDLDAHYGDGTAEIFYPDDRVLYVSVHQDPRTAYPFRGFPEEVGRGRGRGYNVAIPLPPGSGDSHLLAVVEEVVGPLLEAYNPGAVVLSLGTDAHFADPLADLRVTCSGLARAVESVVAAARRLTGRSAVALLEGGYSRASLRCLVDLLASRRRLERPPPGPREGEVLGRLRAFARRLADAHPLWRGAWGADLPGRLVERARLLAGGNPPSRA